MPAWRAQHNPLDLPPSSGSNAPLLPMPSGQFQLIDNPTSFTKLPLASRTEWLGGARRVSTPELSRGTLEKALRGWRFEQVILSSVVPDKAEAIEKIFHGQPLLRVSAKLR